MLKISLLGKTKIEYDGEVLTGKLGNKAIAMVYLMIANKGKYVQRDKLMLYLWPDSAEDAARYNLRYNLWMLKKFLPTDDNGEPLILSEKDSCILNDDYPLECDLLTIKELCIEEADLEQLIYGRSLFAGEIMEGWYLKNCNEFNEYILYDRITCEKCHLEILSTLAAKYETAGKIEEALDVWSEVASMDPENEEVALHIMHLYADAGKRAAALNYYKRFEANLWNSLKITPDIPLTSYYKQLHVMNSEMAELEAADRQSSVDGKREKFLLKAYCIADVEYFLMADILTEALKGMNQAHLKEMDANLVVDLSYIQKTILTAYERAVGKVCEIQENKTPPLVRLILAFRQFMEVLTAHYEVDLRIKNYDDVDSISAKALEYLKVQGVVPVKITLLSDEQ